MRVPRRARAQGLQVPQRQRQLGLCDALAPEEPQPDEECRAAIWHGLDAGGRHGVCGHEGGDERRVEDSFPLAVVVAAWTVRSLIE